MLFEDSWNYRFHRLNWGILGSISIIIGAFYAFIIGFYSKDGEEFLVLILIPSGIAILFGLFLFFLRTEYHKFRIFENGISFTVPLNNPFLPFNQIDFITKADHEGIQIYRKAPNNYPISITSAASNSRAADRIGDWSRFMETLEKSIRQISDEQNEEKFIRSHKKVQWSKEALDALEKRLDWGWTKSNVVRGINEDILKNGRNRVELSDVQRFLK